MGLLNKVGLHLADKYVATQRQGMKLGTEITKDMPVPFQVVGFVGGLLLGSAVGFVRVGNPIDIFDSLLTPEKELEDRLDRKEEYL